MVAVIVALVSLVGLAARSEAPEICPGVPAYPEKRAVNTPWNYTPGHKPDPLYREWITGFGPYYDRIDGAGCTGGTTEQILEWAARKWGIDAITGAGPDLIKAVAVKESDWYQRVQGDHEACTQDWCYPLPGYFGTTYQTYGILGVKRTSWPDSYPSSHVSTAFAADWYGAAFRAYYDGAIPWASGTKGNLLRTIGAWYCGCDDGGGDDYAAQVLAFLAAREWEKAHFATVGCSTNCAP